VTDAPPVVVDASVALKWALDDEDTVEQALALRDDAIDGHFQMFAPTLWVYELANGLTSAVRRSRLSDSAGANALKQLLGLGVRMVDPLPGSTYATASRFGISAYDAAYAALAQALNAPLFTGDGPLLRSTAKALGTRWVGDYEPFQAEAPGEE
jgi:predicted nucleic acid-binding protein